jgi:molybdopterin/thiamine biosynthesis adenylyltransferase
MVGTLSGRSALVIGAGGLGGPVLLTLAASGVGRLVLLDDDVVETSNLNRQPLFGETDLGRPKAEAAAARLRRLHPGVRVEAIGLRFDAGNAAELAASVDVLVDGSDNFATKFLASDAAVAARRPLVHGGVLRYTAQLLTVVPGQTGCLRCLFEEPPAPGTVPTCADAGVLGALAGLAGALMGAEALRVLAGERGAYAGRLVVYEARGGRTRLVPLRRRPGCPACEGRLGPPAASPPPREVESSRGRGAT